MKRRHVRTGNRTRKRLMFHMFLNFETKKTSLYTNAKGGYTFHQKQSFLFLKAALSPVNVMLHGRFSNLKMFQSGTVQMKFQTRGFALVSVHLRELQQH